MANDGKSKDSWSVTAGLGQHPLSLEAIGLALLIAWIEIIYSGDTLLAPPDKAYRLTALLFPFSTIGVSFGCLFFGLNPRIAHSITGRPRIVVGIALVGSAFTLGSAYGGSLHPTLFALLCVGAGLCTVPLTLLWAQKVAEIDSRNTIISFAAAQILAALIYAFAVNMAALVGPAFPIGIMCALLPLSAYVVGVNPTRPTPASGDDALLPKGFWRLICSFAAMAFVCLAVRAYYPNWLEFSEFFKVRYYTAVAIIAVMLALLAIAAATSRRAEFGSFCYNLFLVFTLALVAVPFLGFGSSASVVLATVVLAMCLLVTCVILTRISFKSGADPIRVFGIGYGATIFGCSLGSTFGQTLFEASMPIASVSTISSVLVLVIVATAFFLLPRKHMIELMQPVEIVELDAIDSDDTPALETADDAPVVLDDEPGIADIVEEQSSVVEAGGDLAGEQRIPRFKMRCEQIAIEHGLSPRETEAMFLLAKGRDAKALADELYISYNTARTHIKHIYEKLGVHSRHEFFNLINEDVSDLP